MQTDRESEPVPTSPYQRALSPAQCGPQARRKTVDRMGKSKGTKIGRDAKTGEFIPVREAEKRPNTTTVETLPKKKK